MKLTRGAYRIYIDAVFGGTNSPTWYLIGKDIEDMSTDLNPDVETKKNIIDQLSVVHKGYEVSAEADPFYADPDDALYPKLRDIAMGRLKGDDCKTKILEVMIEDTANTSHLAWQEDVYVIPSSIGGDTSGVSIPFTIHHTGNRTVGTVAIAAATGVPTFTPASSG